MGHVPFRDVISSGDAAGVGEVPADIKVAAGHCQGVDRVVQAGAEGRPGAAGPFRDAVGRAAACGGELTADIEVAAGHRQGVDRVVQAAAEGRPGAAVPFRDAVGRDAARGGEGTADIDIGARHRQGADLAAQAAAESRPARVGYVPFRNVIGRAAAGGGEDPAGIEFAVDHRQGVDDDVRPAAEGRPCAAIPFRNVIDRAAAGGLELTADIEVAAGHRQGIDFVVQAAAEGRPGAAIPFRDVISSGDAAGGIEVPADIKVAAGHCQGVDRDDAHDAQAAGHAGAEGRPGAAGPFRDAVGRAAAGGGEPTADIEIGTRHRQGVDRAIQAVTEGRPARIVRVVGFGRVPFRDVISSGDVAGDDELAADIEICAQHRQGHDPAARDAHAAAEGRPARVVGFGRVPFRDAVGRDAAHVGEDAADIEVAAGHRQGFDLADLAVQAAAEGRPGAAVPLRDAVGGDGVDRGKQAANVESVVGAVVGDHVHRIVRPRHTRIPDLPVGIANGRIDGQRVAGGGIRHGDGQGLGIRHRQGAVQHLPGGVGDVQTVIDQCAPVRQGQTHAGVCVLGGRALQSQRQGQRCVAGGRLCHHEILTQAIAGGGQHFGQRPAIEDHGPIPHADHAGGQRDRRRPFAQVGRRQAEAPAALADRGRFDRQTRRADLAAQGLQGRGQGGPTGGEHRHGRRLLGIGALAKFRQRNGGRVRRQGQTAPQQRQQQSAQPEPCAWRRTVVPGDNGKRTGRMHVEVLQWQTARAPLSP